MKPGKPSAKVQELLDALADLDADELKEFLLRWNGGKHVTKL